MLDYIHINKTAALIVAAIRAGARIGGCSEEQLENLTIYAEHLGLAFQVCEDILDVEGNTELLGKNTGRDEANAKATYPAVHGMEESKIRLKELTDTAIAALAEYYDNAEVFVKLAQQLATRIK